MMLRDVRTVHAATRLDETIDRLLETEKWRVVVVDDDQRVVGMITDGDLVERAAKRARPGGLHAVLDWFGGAYAPPAWRSPRADERPST